MKKVTTYILISLSVILSACKQETIIESDLIYKEKIVVSSYLHPQVLFNGVRITKSLPTSQLYDIKKAEITDALAYIIINGIQVIPLHYDSDGIYEPFFKKRPVPNDTYELFINVNGEEIYSRTIVPPVAEVLAANVIENNRIQAELIPVEGVVYGVAFKYNAVINNEFPMVASTKDIDENGRIYIYSEELPEDIVESSTRIYAKVYAFDQSFEKYFLTRNNNDINDNIFSETGGPVVWNVNQKNTIGMFLGYSDTDWIFTGQ